MGGSSTTSCPRSTFLPSIGVTCPDNIHAGLCGAAWKSDWGHGNAEAFQAALSAAAMFPPTNISEWVRPLVPEHHVKYAFQYFKVLYMWLGSVEREPEMLLSLVDSMRSS